MNERIEGKSRFHAINTIFINLYNPVVTSIHYMYHQFNMNKFYVLPKNSIFMLCLDLRTNSDYFSIQNLLVSFYNRGGVCLLRGRN
jgi:hypothetical protein